ncbi:MAG: hypothetical protein E5W82_10565 [Mesorhizobium sp.]|nr:MAG: hypothetical protein E5W82_10565 [Mesorhizobium sp.]
MDGIKDAKGCWICSASNDKLARQLAELMNFAAVIPDHASDTVDALIQAESFIAGFEDDETQEGVADMLAGLRAAIQRERTRPDMLAALHAVMRCAKGELERPVTQRQPWGEAQRLVEAAIAKAESAHSPVTTGELLSGFGTALGLITKHGLAVDLAKHRPEDFARLEAARAIYAKGAIKRKAEGH